MEQRIRQLELMTLSRPTLLGPAPPRGQGLSFDLTVRRSRREEARWVAQYEQLLPVLLEGLETIADRLAVRRRRLGWWPRNGAADRRRRDLAALRGTIEDFRFAPLSMLETAVGWAVLRRRRAQDGPLGDWDRRTATLGDILTELHLTEELLLTP